MAKYRIRTRQYCALSKEAKWQSWLQSVSQELYDDLAVHLKSGVGCGANQAKMVEIQNKLERSGSLADMVRFLIREYPFAVEKVDDVDSVKEKFDVPKVVDRIKQDVFAHYNPRLLSFPQKAILRDDDADSLLRKVRVFCAGKFGVDYIIVGGTAFIEYFQMKYSKESGKVRDSDREIYKYRVKRGLNPVTKIVKNNV